MSVVVVGAGCIGGWVGGRLAAAGVPVTLIGRQTLQAAVARGGLVAETLGGDQARLGPGAPPVSLDASPCQDAELIIVSVKSGATQEAGALVRRHAPPGTPVLSLQNGLRNPERLEALLPDHPVIAGMVSFNVVWGDLPSGGVYLRLTTSGPIAIAQDAPPQVLLWMQQCGVHVHASANMRGVQWAKLILNLNNAVNALSGLPLKAELSDRGYRRVLAAAMREAWTVLDAAGVKPEPIGRMRPRLAPKILPLPDFWFRLIAAPMIKIDPEARSSMADDVARGRRTEVQDINGEVVRLGADVGVPTPVNAHLVKLVEGIEGPGSPRLSPDALWPS